MDEILHKTPLDLALEAVRSNKHLANHFYDTFLNTDVFAPVEIAGKPGSWKLIDDSDKFHPLFVTYQQTRVVPLFDTLERLRAWAGERPLDYMGIRCYRFLQILAPNVAVAVNLGTEFSYYFQANILDSLRKAMKPVSLS